MYIKTKIFPHIPNFITILNLISGTVGIYLVLEGNIYWGCYMIYLAGLFDFFDGFIARLLHASSEIGKSLDSLADIISFGLLPTAILFKIIESILVQSNPDFSVNTASISQIILLGSSVLIISFSALRLAKFNTDTRQTYGFIGVPTPATAFLISSFPFIINDTESVGAFFLTKLYVIVPLALILSLLMVSEIPMISLKFKNFELKENIYKYLLIILSVSCIIIWGIASIPLIFLFYVILSYTQSKLHKNLN